MTASLSRLGRAAACAVVVAGCHATKAPVTAHLDSSRVEWLSQHALPIRSVTPTDTSFEDLEALRPFFARARVVQLGDATHGDGAALDARVRMVKFLHERMGFDVLAVEAGLYDCRRSWAAIVRRGEPAAEATRNCLSSNFRQSAAGQELARYLAEQAASSRPLELWGFDPQLTGHARTPPALAADLSALVGHLEPGVTWAEVGDALAKLNQYELKRSDVEHQRAQTVFSALLRAFEQRMSAADLPLRETAGFWRQVLVGLATEERDNWADQQGRDAEAGNIRDAQMADNLVWLATKRHAGHKIIVLAASSHLMHGKQQALDGVRQERLGHFYDLESMGERVKRVLGAEVATVAFLAYEGQAGLVGKPAYPVERAPDDSLEAMLAQARLDSAFLELARLPAGSWLREPVRAGPFGYVPIRGRWPQVFDAFVFVRRMYPCTPASPLPPAE
jgi:erythromycin esterase